MRHTLILSFTTTALAGFYSLPATAPAYKIYFGDNHSHTSYSDGVGRRKADGTWPVAPNPTPADAFEHARRSDRADYLVVSDHSGYAPGIYFNLNPTLWASSRQMAKEYTNNGAFVAIVGPEYSPATSIGAHLEGHMNIYNTGPDFFPGPMSQDGFYDRIAANRAIIAQWNHPSLQYAGYNFKQFSGWTLERNRVISLIEIYSEDQGRMESAYRLALDRNWKVAPVASSDTHTANWITGYEARTAVLARELTTEAIYDSWRNRRCYATENRNLQINFEINGYPMGSSIPAAPTYELSVRVNDPDTQLKDDEISTIDLISNGSRIAASKTLNAYKGVWTYSLPATGKSAYYYGRIKNKGGQLAWTAPIWLPSTRTTVSPVPGISRQLNLAWAEVKPDPDGYEIWRRPGERGSFALWKTVKPANTTFTDESVQPGTRYFYKVRTFSRNTRGAFSNEASASPTEPDTQPPTIPKNLKLLSATSSRIEFAFPPATDNQLLMSYGLVRDGVDLPLGKFAGCTERLISGATLIKVVDLDSPNSGHRVEPGRKYKYQVYAVDYAGNRSALSQPLSVTAATQSGEGKSGR